jgi:hypothetical protein
VAKHSPYLNTAQAAHYLGISERTLKLMRGKGIGPPFCRFGRSIRYHIDKLKAWSQTMEHTLLERKEDKQLSFDFMTQPRHDPDGEHP